MSMSVLNMDINVLFVVITLLDRIDVFVPMATNWLQMADIVLTSMNVPPRPTTVDMTVKILLERSCVFAQRVFEN